MKQSGFARIRTQRCNRASPFDEERIGFGSALEIVRIKQQFCSVFGDTARKITTIWAGSMV